MTAIDHIHAIVASGTTATAAIAEELTRRGIEAPRKGGWTARARNQSPHLTLR